jgi:3-ketoacyl-CoA synthase
MVGHPRRSKSPPLAVRTRSDDAAQPAPTTEEDVFESASEWARVSHEWITRRVDVVRGFLARDLTEYLLRASLLLLSAYAVYLAWCESCKADYTEYLTALRDALFDFVTLSRGSLSAAVVAISLTVWLLTVRYMRSAAPIYLVDFKTYRHKDVPGGDPSAVAGEPVVYERFLEESRRARNPLDQPCFNGQSIEFQEKIMKTSGISEASIFPPAIFPPKCGQYGKDAERIALNMSGARDEAEAMMCRAVEQLLEATNTAPEDIGIVIVNCSLFCPTPSLSAMLVNRFRMRSDVLSFNLGGMGCSASVISVDLARRLLRGHEQRNTLALVVSTENITQNWYRGNDRSMLLSNCLFRCGAAAMLLSNRRRDAGRARFKLCHTVRTHMGKEDSCYRSVYQEEDADGIRGVRLSKQIMQIAGDALKRNITNLGPLVLPITEQLKFFLNIVARGAARGRAGGTVRAAARAIIQLPVVRSIVGFRPNPADQPVPSPAKSGRAAPASPKPNKPDDPFLRSLPPYVPDFTKAFEWICVHTGGRAVIDAMEQNLALPSHYLEPSRLSLYRYGNVSSASIWYELELIAEHGNQCGLHRPDGNLPPVERKLRRGDRIWQIAFGSGFKCNSAVWQCLRGS